MIHLRDVKMRPKLIVTFLVAGLVPLAAIGWLGIQRSSDALMAGSFAQLEAVQQIKQGQITQYFSERMGDIRILADNPTTKRALRELVPATRAAELRGNSRDGLLRDDEYRDAHDQFHATFRFYKETYGYYDLFLIAPGDGAVVYTVVKEPDFGTHLAEETEGLADSWTDAVRMGRASIVDMAQYTPSAGAAAMFVAAPVT